MPSEKSTDNTNTRSWTLNYTNGTFTPFYEILHDGSQKCNDITGGQTLANCDKLNTVFSTTAPTNGGQHYRIGNYYSWNTSTAGTGGEITSGQASDSICPKEWKLPTSNNTSNGSFSYLLTQYGVASKLSGTGTNVTNGTSGKSYNIASEPLYFTRSGYVRPNSPSLGSTGLNARYWSSTPDSNTSVAYSLYFSASGVNPSSYGTNRYLGFSLRCLAR